MNINTYGDNKYSIDTPNQKDPGLNTTDVETKVKTNDETVVYSLGVYLRRLVLPQFINGLRNRSISPLDGEVCAMRCMAGNQHSIFRDDWNKIV